MNEIISHNGKLYIVKRRIPHSYFNKRDGSFVSGAITLWKEWLSVDIALKNQTHYLFCMEIPELECELINE